MNWLPDAHLSNRRYLGICLSGRTLVCIGVLLSIVMPMKLSAAASLRDVTVQHILTIGISVPAGSKEDYLDSVTIAIQRATSQNRIPGVAFRLRFLADDIGGNYSGALDAANARTFIDDPTVIGEVGPDNSGAAEASMPVYNRAGLLQISPDNTLVNLTDPANLTTFQPATAAGTEPRTYYRTATNDGKQSAGAARFAHDILHVKTTFVVSNSDPYGIGLAQEFARAARTSGIQVLGTAQLSMAGRDLGARAMAATIARQTAGNVDLVYFGGYTGDGGGAEPLVKALRQIPALRGVIFMGGDGIGGSDFIKNTTPVIAEGSYATGVGFPTNANVVTPHMSRILATALHTQYPHYTMSNYDNAIFDATNVVIEATARAMSKGTFQWGVAPTDVASIKANREAVARQVRTIRSFPGATGALGFDANGDTTTHAAISVYEVIRGTWRFVAYAPGYGPLNDRFLK